MFSYLTTLFKTVMIHCFTGIDGVTYDPARIAGYGTGIVGVAAFAADCVMRLVTVHSLDGATFAIEFGALSAGLAGIAASVQIKSKTEPTQ